MKKAFILLVCIMMVISSAVTLNTYAADDIKIVIDNENQSYDQMPVIMNDRTLVPLRGIFEALGAEVDWIDATKTIIGSKNDKTVILQVGNTTASMNNKKVTLDVSPTIVNSRTMVPVRFVSEALGANVEWVADTRTVVIKSNEFIKKEQEQDQTQNGKVIFDSGELTKRTIRTINNSAGTELNYVDDKLYVNIKTLPAKDLDVNVTFKAPIDATINQSDICLITFKARLLSGGTDGMGYIKVWAQNEKSTKALFARTKVGTEWTECYLPFIGIANMQNIGMRFGGMVQELEIKDFSVINYGPKKDITTLKSTFIIEENTVVPKMEKNDEPVINDVVSVPELNLDNLPKGGTFVVDNNQFIKDSKNYTNNFANMKFENGVLMVDVHTMPDKDLKVYNRLDSDIASTISQGDVCIMVFEARCTSGNGYIKPWVQDGKSIKALFAKTSVGKDWTICYLPFTGKNDLANVGLRFGGEIQKVEVRNFNIINYKNSINLSDLPSTIIE